MTYETDRWTLTNEGRKYAARRYPASYGWDRAARIEEILRRATSHDTDGDGQAFTAYIGGTMMARRK